MALSDDVKAAIRFKELAVVNFVLGAAIQDDYGNWETAECFLDRAVEIDNDIAQLQSICEDIESNVSTDVPVTCDITKRGIGVWAIGTPRSNSSVGCSVLTVVGTNTPPPYGEFKRDEFKLDDFTKIIE